MSEADNTILQPLGQTGACSPVLLVKRKKKVVARVALDKFVMTLGRAPDCDIVLDVSDAVSRSHAQILVLDGEVVIEDLNSRNGVLVNRKPRKRHTLRPGDRIAIGEYRLHILFDQGDRLERPQSEHDTVELIRRWKGAAVVTAEQDRCPLCHASVADSATSIASRQATPAGTNAADALGPALRRRLRRKLIRRRKSPA